MMEKSTRREFCVNSTKIVAAAGVVSILPLGVSCSTANKKIVIGAIGLRNMGLLNLRTFLKNQHVECGALCDIDESILNERAADIEKIHSEKADKGENITNKKPQCYKDYRKLLENKDIDAVIIATQDSWHCLIAVDAMAAGKHVYVEKPMTNTIHEAMLLERAVKKYGKVLTVGQWQRSGKHWLEVVDYLRSGKLGKISRVNAWAYTAKKPLTSAPDGPVPQGVDYDMWLGPAPERPFNPNRFHYNHRYYWDYAGGLMADWGVHMLDFALFGMDAGMPKSIASMGGQFSRKDARETPDTLNVLYQYDDFSITWEHSICLSRGPYGLGHGLVFQGNEGMLLVTRDGWNVKPEDGRNKVNEDDPTIEEIPWTKGGGGLDEHVANFLDCIRNGGTPNASVEVGKKVAMLAHMGNISYRTGERLKWDDENKKFSNSDAANAFLVPEYRAPWKLPEL